MRSPAILDCVPISSTCRRFTSLAGVDVKTAPNLRVGYVMGSGDDVPASLENLGVKTHFSRARRTSRPETCRSST